MFIIGDEEPMDVDPSEDELDDEFKPQMPSLTSDIEIQPTFGQEPSSFDPYMAGRLLTPAEGCGSVAVSTKRIVGGSPAKNGILRKSVGLTMFLTNG